MHYSFKNTYQYLLLTYKSSNIIMSAENINETKYLNLHGTEILVDKVKELIEDVRKEIKSITGSTGIDGSQSFTLTPATTDLLGGIKVGDNLSATDDGTLTAKGYSWDDSTSTMSVTGKIEASDGVFNTSDARKKDIQGELPLDKAYDFIRNCEPILYNLKGSDKTQIGLIAQEVREFFPEIVNEDSEGYLSLDYAKLTVIILRVLKDLIDKK